MSINMVSEKKNDVYCVSITESHAIYVRQHRLRQLSYIFILRF